MDRIGGARTGRAWLSTTKKQFFIPELYNKIIEMWRGVVWMGSASRDKAWRCEARYGSERYGMER